MLTTEISVDHAVPAARTHSTGLIAVSAVYLLSQLVFVVPHVGFSNDEAIYVSQVSSQAPAAFFSAPRARGMSLLVAPITMWTSHVWVLRVYLAVLSAAALFAVFWLWRPLRGDRVIALAAVLFGSLWITQFYGPGAMPNMWVAISAVAVVACFLRAVANPADRLALGVLAGAVALAALMRPSDAVWLSLPMLVAIAVRRSWRRISVAGALVGGLVIGAVPWVVESYTRYGGLAARLHRSNQIEGGFGLHFAFIDQLKSQTGTLLCRPCAMTFHQPLASAWLIALPLLAAASVALALHTPRAVTTVLPVACAASVAIPYVFLINYAAPRFLLPTYALLAIPIAELIATLVRRARPSTRPALLSLLAVCLVGHIAFQYAVLWHTTRGAASASSDQARIADALNRFGVRSPCLVTGDEAIPIGFAAGCRSAAPSGNNANMTVPEIVAMARREPVGVVVPAGAAPPTYAAAWHMHAIPRLTRYAGERVYVSE